MTIEVVCGQGLARAIDFVLGAPRERASRHGGGDVRSDLVRDSGWCEMRGEAADVEPQRQV